MTAARRPSLVVLAAALSALLVGCGGDDDPRPAAASTPSPTPSATPSEAPPPPPPPAADPLTGVIPAPASPLVAVKIDGAPLARPYLKGLDTASVVYVELVEGGATRMMALYSQPPDGEVGPIRSFRESDVELLVQHGRLAVAFSGANAGVLASFRDAVRAGQLVEVSYENKPELYRIGERRRDAKNFYANPARLAQVAGEMGAAPARDVGWTFAADPRPDAAPASTARVVFSDREVTQLAYDPPSGRYAVLQGGEKLRGAAPANVVVQQVQVRPGRYVDVTGGRSPYVGSVGTGPVHVLRDGRRVDGTWSRPDPGAGTTLLDAAGQPIALKPGPTWVLLQPAGLPFGTA